MKVAEIHQRGQVSRNYNVIRCTVRNVVQRESSEVDRKTNLTIAGSQRAWREIEVRDDTGQEFLVSGEVVYDARVGDNILLVHDLRGREPLCLANLSSGKMSMHSSADPNARPGKSVFAYAVLIALAAAIPGLFAYFAVLVTVFPDRTDADPGWALKFYPLFLLPLSLYAAVRLDRWAVARAKRIHREVAEVLSRADVDGLTIAEGAK
jgi:hypothetical protein